MLPFVKQNSKFAWNQRLEAAFKDSQRVTAKKIVNGNTGLQGSLDNDNVVWAILQYRNTPIHSIGLSPVQLLLHCQLCDSIPSKPILYKPYSEWVAAAQHRKEIHCNSKMVEKDNKYTHNLPPLQAGDSSNPKPTQSLLESYEKNHRCPIRSSIPISVDGSGRITLRNCCFLRKYKLKPTPTPISSATPGTITPTSNASLLQHYPPKYSVDGTHTQQLNPPNKPYIHHHAFNC